MSETLLRKRYTGRSAKPAPAAPRVFVCAYCGCLSCTSRSHTITCGNACRVALHRHPEKLDHLQRCADAVEVPVQSILDARAATELVPDVCDEIMNGTESLDSARNQIYQAYASRLFEAARHHLETTP